MSILANMFHHIESGVGQPWVLAASRSPGFLPDTVFENHYGIWIAGIALGALLIMVARSKARKPILYAGQAILVITLIWMLLARGFDTKGERLYAVHQGMAMAAEKGDVDALVGYFDKSFGGSEIAGKLLTSDTAKEGIKDILKQANPKDITIRSYSQHFLEPTGAASTLTVYAKTEYGPTVTTWQLSWDDVAGQDWRLVNAKMVQGPAGP
jgi:hypothetical protein